MKSSTKTLMLGGLAAGVLLFAGATFQQVGLQYTTAGKAGFITGMYIFFRTLDWPFLPNEKQALGTWLGAVIALWGLYLLSINDDFSLSKGDTLQLHLCGGLCWARIDDWLSCLAHGCGEAIADSVFCSRHASNVLGVIFRTAVLGYELAQRLCAIVVCRGGVNRYCLHPTDRGATARTPFTRGHHTQLRRGICRAWWVFVA